MNRRINPNLRKLAELTHNPSLELPDLEEITKEQVPVQTNQLERDAQGKPKIKLTPLEKTAVNTLTQEEYNTLMQVYERGGWKWCTGELPTSENLWKDYKEKTCIKVSNKFTFATRNYYEKERYHQIIPTKEFYNKQNITPDMIKEINKYFESKK